MLMDVANPVHTTSHTMLTVTWCHSECCVPSGLNFEAAGGSVVRYSSKASNHCVHDMGSLSWLNAETLKRAPTVFHPWTLICKTTVMLFLKALFEYSIFELQSNTIL